MRIKDYVVMGAVVGGFVGGVFGVSQALLNTDQDIFSAYLNMLYNPFSSEQQILYASSFAGASIGGACSGLVALLTRD